MIVLVPLSNGVTVQSEGATPLDCFRQVADVQKTFEDTKCGLCSSNDLQYVVRKVEDNEFFELRCKACHGKLTFGIGKTDKNLYPKRYQTDNKGKALKDENGKGIPLGKNKNGWIKYNPQTGKDE